MPKLVRPCGSWNTETAEIISWGERALETVRMAPGADTAPEGVSDQTSCMPVKTLPAQAGKAEQILNTAMAAYRQRLIRNILNFSIPENQTENLKSEPDLNH